MGISRNEREIITPFLAGIDSLSFIKQKDTIIAFSTRCVEDIATVQQTLNVRKSGVAIGIIKGKDLVPHHELALSFIVNPNMSFYKFTYENAVRYLKRSELPAGMSNRGWTLARYNNLNIGWMKVLPNRINNYYPTEWRILKH